MALGRQKERQADLMVGWAELPRAPGHVFYDRLQAVLIAAGFDGFAESQCAPYYAGKRGFSLPHRAEYPRSEPDAGLARSAASARCEASSGLGQADR
jgi:transposase